MRMSYSNHQCADKDQRQRSLTEQEFPWFSYWSCQTGVTESRKEKNGGFCGFFRIIEGKIVMLLDSACKPPKQKCCKKTENI